ncbi:Commd1 [Phodopus roborovskii]|uniref:COMM domain-containing protein 1 n=1 Tax=Phodopus roborovskii TaxID=109678 RepID=A0AAV0A163_PHORO|nr:Commd1 [Phodopus roborovskii]
MKLGMKKFTSIYSVCMSILPECMYVHHGHSWCCGGQKRTSDVLELELQMSVSFRSIASADMDFNQLEAFLTAQTKKQGGITCEQAAVISKFWKSHKTRIRESLLNQSRWDNGLRGLSWRVDGKSQSRHSAQIDTPVAIVELEFGKSGQSCEDFNVLSYRQSLNSSHRVLAVVSKNRVGQLWLHRSHFPCCSLETMIEMLNKEHKLSLDSVDKLSCPAIWITIWKYFNHINACSQRPSVLSLTLAHTYFSI